MLRYLLFAVYIKDPYSKKKIKLFLLIVETMLRQSLCLWIDPVLYLQAI